MLLTNIYKKGPDGSWQEKTFSGPSHVMWRWPQHTPPHLTVGPPSIATFGALLEGEDRFQLQLYFSPNNLDRFIRVDDPTRLTFVAVSDATKSIPITIELAWDGEFHKGIVEMNHHCMIKQVVDG